MTKTELIEQLKPFDGDQEVIISLYSETYPNGSQIAIQGIDIISPWHGDLKIIGLKASVNNRVIEKDNAVR